MTIATTRRGFRPAAALLPLLVAACDWVSLAAHALAYDTVPPGASAHVAVARESLFVVTRADDGFVLLDATGRMLTAVPLPEGAESVDDVAVAGDLLFVLDARPPGHLAAYSLGSGVEPRLVSAPLPVPVGPFSRLSVRRGAVVVSGGTSRLTAWRYDATGVLRGPIATADLGRGQPVAAIAPSGDAVYVAVHRWGPYFGVGIIDARPTGDTLATLGTLAVEGAGFTDGGAKPASFPMGLASLDDSTLLLAHGRGLAVVHTGDRAHPRMRRLIDLAGPAVSVDVLEGAAAVTVAGSRPAVVVLALDASGAPAMRRIPLPPGTRPLGVALSRAHIAVALRDRGVAIFDR